MSCMLLSEGCFWIRVVYPPVTLAPVHTELSRFLRVWNVYVT